MGSKRAESIAAGRAVVNHKAQLRQPAVLMVYRWAGPQSWALYTGRVVARFLSLFLSFFFVVCGFV